MSQCSSHRTSRRNLPLSDRFATIDTGLWLTKHRAVPRTAVPTSILRRVLSQYLAFGPTGARSDVAWPDHTRILIDAAKCAELLDEAASTVAGDDDASDSRRGGTSADDDPPTRSADVTRDDESDIDLDSPVGRYIQGQFSAKPLSSFLEVICDEKPEMGFSKLVLPAAASSIVATLMKQRTEADPLLEWHVTVYGLAAHALLLQHAAHAHIIGESLDADQLTSFNVDQQSPPVIQSLSTDPSLPYVTPHASLINAAQSCRDTLVRLNAPTSSVNVASIAVLTNVKYLQVTIESGWRQSKKEDKALAQEAAATSRCRPTEMNLTVDVSEVLNVVTGLFSAKMEDVSIALAQLDGGFWDNEEEPGDLSDYEELTEAHEAEAFSIVEKAANFVASQVPNAYPVLHRLCVTYDENLLFDDDDDTPTKSIALLSALVSRSPRLESFETRGLPLSTESDLLFDLSQKTSLFAFASDVSPGYIMEGCRIPKGRNPNDIIRPFGRLRQLEIFGEVDAGELSDFLFLDTVSMQIVRSLPESTAHFQDMKRLHHVSDEARAVDCLVVEGERSNETHIGAQLDQLSVGSICNTERPLWHRIADACPALTDLNVLCAESSSTDALLEASRAMKLKCIAMPLPPLVDYHVVPSTLVSAVFNATSSAELTTPRIIQTLLRLPATMRSVHFVTSDGIANNIDAPSARDITAVFTQLPKLLEVAVAATPIDLEAWAAVWPAMKEIRFSASDCDYHLPMETSAS